MNWIPVSERYPDKPGKYLCAFSDGDVETFTLDEDDIEPEGRMNVPWSIHHVFVTHWMPVPELPEESV